MRGLIALALSLLPALAVALYYALLFHRDPLWGASNMLRLPPPDIAILIAAFGPLLALALLGARAYRGERVVVTWAIVNGALLLTPLPQSERLLNGWSVPLALLAATALCRLRARAARRWVVGLSLSSVTLALLYLMMTATGANPAYYEPTAEAAAVQWLAAHTGPNDVVMASAGSGNLIVSAARCRVVVGQNFETFRWAQAQAAVLRYYDAATPPTSRAAIVRRLGVTLVLAGPYEAALGRFTPSAGHDGYRLAYSGGSVRVYAVGRG